MNTENIQEMDLETASVEISNRVYEACKIFEQLEHAGKISGNGHHMRQEIREHAVKLLTERWKLKKQVMPI